MKVLLTGGGSSQEREVSLKTTDAMESALNTLGISYERHDVVDELDLLDYWTPEFDLVLLGLHGRRGEDGLLQSALESRGIPFTGAGAISSTLAFSKSATKRLLQDAGVPTPDWELHFHVPGQTLPATSLEYPLVIKPDAEGSTIGLSICQAAGELRSAARTSGSFSRLLYETFIPGRELTVGVLAGKALPVVEIFPGHELYDYASKYTKGMSNYQCPAALSPDLARQIRSYAEMAMQSVGVEVYGRVDFRLDPEGTPWCLEINTLPGMTATSLLPMGAAADGLDFSELIQRILDLSLEKGMKG